METTLNRVVDSGGTDTFQNLTDTQVAAAKGLVAGISTSQNLSKVEAGDSGFKNAFDKFKGGVTSLMYLGASAAYAAIAAGTQNDPAYLDQISQGGFMQQVQNFPNNGAIWVPEAVSNFAMHHPSPTAGMAAVASALMFKAAGSVQARAPAKKAKKNTAAKTA